MGAVPALETGSRAEPISIPWLDRIKPQDAWLQGSAYLLAKRIMDLAIVVLAMPIVLPVMGVVALLIRIDSPGAPAVFSQMRVGKGGATFRLYKFRTMVPNAEALKAQLWHLNELKPPAFKMTNDPRVTRIGRLLRKTSLDELPQIFNVLKGEMSLVGPRPTSFSVNTYALWQTERLDVVPGLAGLWQITGRGETEFRDWLPADIAYIERRCLWLDVQLLVRTAVAVLRQRGAR